ncbi:SGNH/GDSL hydrolase family protein [Cumulibacter manganitolerans]|uniref:SGNH/GDSL hydrolase family protein n=1 Tax=Cumulibacter manganitolerans TaxID=1884992 RepID=UPI001E6397BA|nr:SGNH/GDSL hydrolase family protein [Cumulibacter manganitolerans]
MSGVLRFAAIGDSFTEGIGDELADGRPRGWADLTAQQIAARRPVEYVNLAIRGRLLEPIATVQLDAALALGPDLLTFNGGGNDLLRPSYDPQRLTALTERVITRAQAAGVRLVVLSGADPSRHLPFGSRVNAAGVELTRIVRELTDRHGVEMVDNFGDAELARGPYWSADRLHLNADGHRRVAARLLAHLGYEPPADWLRPHPQVETRRGAREQAAYYRQHVAPWVWRHLRGRSSGDGVQPKHATWTPVDAG